MLALALKALSIGKGIFSPLASLWRWLTADWHRMAFAVLIALCAFLTLRLHSVDGDRDGWRDKARSYEAASKAIKAADKVADDVAVKAAEQTKGEIDAGNERAAEAARGSDDPLGAAFGSLRAEANRGSGKATR